MQKIADTIVFIGRFQIIHNAHCQIIDNALAQADKLILLVGSYKTSISPKNPWTYEQRYEMIYQIYEREITSGRLIIRPVRDYLYCNPHWISSVQNIVASLTEPNETVKIIGHYKDDSSKYLNFFANWELIKEPNYCNGLDATALRHTYLGIENDPILEDHVPGVTLSYLHDFKFKNIELWNNLKESLEFTIDYLKPYARLKYKPVFVTTDAVVIKSGHLLLIRRGRNPGKGQYALPGGFLGERDVHFDSCIRELYEETRIDVPKPRMYDLCTNTEGIKFDHPDRDPRGRVVTTAYHFDLTEKNEALRPLPRVKASDDAQKNSAVWMPFNDVIANEDQFFIDHIHIIQKFIEIGG